MDKSSTNLPQIVLFFDMFLVAIDWFGIIARFVQTLKYFLQPNNNSFLIRDEKTSLDSHNNNNNKNDNDKKPRVVSDIDVKQGSLRREEVEMVMERLGLFCSPESERLNETFGELSRLFDENEPSLEELKKAFDVFDENKDGFFDAAELQRVLRLLGLRQGSDIELCKRMIGNVDANSDGKIDFHEFVKFMETIFC